MHGMVSITNKRMLSREGDSIRSFVRACMPSPCHIHASHACIFHPSLHHVSARYEHASAASNGHVHLPEGSVISLDSNGTIPASQ